MKTEGLSKEATNEVREVMIEEVLTEEVMIEEVMIEEVTINAMIDVKIDGMEVLVMTAIIGV